MLSKEELSRYGTATLTSVFLDRVFQECLTYDGEMVQCYLHVFHTLQEEQILADLTFCCCHQLPGLSS